MTPAAVTESEAMAAFDDVEEIDPAQFFEDEEGEGTGDRAGA